MSSLRELDAAKLLKRADLPKIRLDQIHAEPGFNPAEPADDYARRVDGIANHLREGGTVPPIEVRPRDAGGMWIVDGHARVDAYRRAALAGAQLQDPKDGQIYVLATIFQGSDSDRTLRLITSAEGRTLTPLQQSEVVKRLRNYGWSASEIARKTGRSAEFIGQLLALGDADSSVKEMITSGQVSALVAAKAVRKHKGEAKTVLASQLQAAQAQGKTRVTAATIAHEADKPSSATDTEPAPAPAPTAPAAHQPSGYTDTQRLDFMIAATATVVRVDGGFAVRMPGDDERERFDTARQALDAFMADADVPT